MNFKERCLKNRKWIAVRDEIRGLESMIDSLYKQGRVAYESRDYEQFARCSKRLQGYEIDLRSARARLQDIEDDLYWRAESTVKEYVIEDDIDPMSDDYIIYQIIKNGYLTGSKF